MPVITLTDRISTMFSIMLKSVGKQADLKRLTNYIIAINQKESTEDILSELSHCLKDILNYRLFAFVIQEKGCLDIWLDPHIYKDSLEEIIIKDFNVRDKGQLNYLDYSFSHEENTKMDKRKKININTLASYEIDEDNYFARIYLLPYKTLFDFHDDEIDMIIKTTQTAISRQIDMKKLSDAAAMDPLTQCYNRRELETQLQRNVSNATRHGKELSVFMFDLDYFKKINDTHGHKAGDIVLKEVSALVRTNIRSGDILARYGGEEFFAILPETDKKKAMELANRIRENIAATRIQLDDKKIRVTASFGVATLKEAVSVDKLVNEADAMMYKAKLNGRNIVMPGLIKVCPTLGSEQKVKN